MSRRTKQTYRVTGSTAYRGNAPDTEFDAVLTEDEERRAIDRGSIKRVTKSDTTKGKGESDG